MSENKADKPIKVENLSQKSQAKLKEIMKKQGFKTTDEAVKYLTEFFGSKK